MENILRRITASNGSSLNIEELEELAKRPEAFRGYAKENLSYFTGHRTNFSTNQKPMSELQNAAQLLGQIASSPFLTEDNQNHGISSYVTSKKGRNQFSIQIANTTSGGSAADIQVALFAGAFRGTSAIVTNSILDSVSGITVASKTPNKQVAHLIQHVNENPSLLENIRVQSTDPNQVVEKFYVKREYAFRDSTTTQIDPSDFKSEYNTIDTFLNVKTKEQINASTILLYTVRAGATVTLTFTFSVVMNRAVTFDAFIKGLDSATAFVGEPSIQQAAIRAGFTGVAGHLG